MNYTLYQEYVKLCDALRAGLPIIRVKIESSSAHESIFRLEWGIGVCYNAPQQIPLRYNHALVP